MVQKAKILGYNVFTIFIVKKLKGKMKKITRSLVGVGASAWMLASGVMPVSASTTPVPMSPPPGMMADATLSTLVPTILNVVFGIGAVIALFFLIYGAYSWITSSGDKGNTEKARNRIVAAVVGLILLSATWAIMNIVLGILGAGSASNVFNNMIRLTPAPPKTEAERKAEEDERNRAAAEARAKAEREAQRNRRQNNN